MRTSVTLIAYRKAPLLVLVVFTMLVNAVCFGQAMNDEDNVNEDEPLTLNLGFNDILPQGPRIYSLASQPEFGTFTWLNTGTGLASLTVEPQVFFEHNWETFTFDYEVCVGTFCDTATVEILLRFRNDNPFANNDTLYVETGTGRWGDVNPNDGDPDSLSDPITGNYTSWQVIPPSYADLTVSPIDSFPKRYGTFYYKPIANFIGEDYFTYYREEPLPCFGVSQDAYVTIFVVPSNENPVAGDATISNAIEEQPITYNLLPLTSDPENEVLHFAIAGQPQGGFASVHANGLLSYTSANNFIGLDTVSYTVMDLVGQLDTGYVYIQVANGNNDAPKLQSSSAITSEDLPVNFSIATVDGVDGDALTYQIVSATALGTYTVGASGVINYTPPANFSGNDIIRYRACDSFGLCDTAEVILTITPVNDAPIAANDFNTTIINGTVNGQMAGNDSDIDNTTNQLTYILLDSALHGTVSIQENGTYTYTSGDLYFGEDSFTYRVCDSQGLCDDADVVIDVLYTNLPPQTEDFNASTPEDGSIVIDLTGVSSDFNGGDLSFNLLSTSTFGAFTPIVNTGFNFTPLENLSGTFEISYRVCDTGNLCDTALLSIDIAAVNDAPVVQSQILTVLEDNPTAWTVAYTDIDSDNTNLTLEVLEYPEHGTLSAEFNYLGNSNYHGADAFTFRICDSEGGCTTVTQSVIVEAIDDAPVAISEAFSVVEDSGSEVIPLNNNDTDVDGDELQYVLLSGTDNHTVNLSVSGLMAISPAQNFNGIITLDYAVCDGIGLCDTAAFVLTVTPVNDLPQSNFPALQANEDVPFTFDPAPYVVDVEDDQVAYSIISSQGVAATLDTANQTYSLNPVADFFGEALLVIQVCDAAAPCITDTLLIQIEPVNDAPMVSDIDVFTFVNIPAEGELIGFVSDVDDVAFTASIENNENGNLIIDSTLHFSYTPSQDFIGTNSIVITICDMAGLCDTALFKIEVFPSNQAPDATPGSFETCQAQSFTIPIASLVTDDAQPAEDLIYTFSSSAPAQIILSTPATEATIIPSSIFAGLMTIDMVVCDNASPALCDTAQYQLEVIPSFTPEITAVTINHISCNGLNDGSILINGTTDSNQTTFQWSNGQEGDSVSTLAPGDYVVIMNSNTACSLQGTASFTINEPDLLSASFSSTNISDISNGSIVLSISGGTDPYVVTWTGPQGFSSSSVSLIDISTGGMYQAEISDANGCATSLEVNITSHEEHVNQTFGIYPNPVAENNLQVELSSSMPMPCAYSITDLSGKTVQQGTISVYRQTLDITHVAGGCYLLSIGEHSMRLMRH
jgi:hypothetical protein